MCHGVVDMAAIEALNSIIFDEYFAKELRQLLVLQDDGLIDFAVGHITRTSSGQLLIRTDTQVKAVVKARWVTLSGKDSAPKSTNANRR
jgi:hypothetical protein